MLGGINLTSVRDRVSNVSQGKGGYKVVCETKNTEHRTKNTKLTSQWGSLYCSVCNGNTKWGGLRRLGLYVYMYAITDQVSDRSKQMNGWMQRMGRGVAREVECRWGDGGRMHARIIDTDTQGGIDEYKVGQNIEQNRAARRDNSR